MKKMRVRIVVSMIALSFSVMLSACGQEEANSVEAESMSIMEDSIEIEENNSIETVEEESVISEETEVVEEESIVSEEAEDIKISEPIEEPTEEISNNEIVETEPDDFATDTNLGGTEEDFMNYLEQNGFGGTYYDGDSASDDGGYQFGSGGDLGGSTNINYQ